MSAPTEGAWTDRELVLRMRERDARAFRQFFARFRMLLKREARRLGLQPALHEEAIEDCLADVTMSLIDGDGEPPASLPAYLLGAMRNRAASERRTAQRGEKRDRAALEDAPGIGDRVVLAACSRATIDASAGLDYEEATLAPTLRGLANALEIGLNKEELDLLVWLGDWVPQPTIATWMGISFGAARVRIHRLRARLRKLADDHASTLGAAERRELDRFLERSAKPAPGKTKWRSPNST